MSGAALSRPTHIHCGQCRLWTVGGQEYHSVHHGIDLSAASIRATTLETLPLVTEQQLTNTLSSSLCLANYDPASKHMYAFLYQ